MFFFFIIEGIKFFNVTVLVDDFCIGMGYGWSAPVLTYLTSPDIGFNLTAEQVSWVIALAELGKFTSPIAGGLVDKFGRRSVLVLCAVMYVCSWLGVAVTRSVIVLSISRYVFGLALGLNDVASCIYIGEVTHPSVRGAFLSGLTTLFFAGILCGFVLGNYLSYDALAYSILFFAVLFLLLCPLLVETPQYLLVQNEYDRAKKTLTRLRSDEPTAEVETELLDIRDHIMAERERRPNFAKAISDRTNLKIFLLIMALSAAGPMSGYNAIVYYASKIFRQEGMITANQFTILYGVIQLLTSFTTTCVIEMNGRRFLLLTFAALSTVIHLATASLYYAQETLHYNIEHFSWIIFATVTSYSALFTFGFLPTNFTLRSELFPHDLKGFGGSIAVICHAGSSFVCSKTFPTIQTALGTYVNFLLYSAASLITFFVTYFWIPETKGKTLVEIQKHFRNEI